MKASTPVSCAALAFVALFGCQAATSPAASDVDAAVESYDAAVTSPGSGTGTGDRPAPDASRDTRRGKLDMRPDGAPTQEAFFGESRCPAGTLLCEDFEGNALDPARWSLDLKKGMTGIDNSDFARGSGFFVATLTSGINSGDGNRAFIHSIKTFPIVAGASLWIRLFIRLDKYLPNHWTPLFGAEDQAAGGYRFMAYRPPGDVGTGKETVADYHLLGTPNLAVRSVSYNPELDKWTCWEMEFRGATAIHFYVNGQELTELTGQGGPDLHEVNVFFGAKLTLDDPNLRKGYGDHYDAIAVSKERVGCDQ